MTTKELKALRETATEALGIIDRQRLFSEPVNWANLSCRKARWISDDSGEFYAEIDVSEASPDGCPKLCALLDSMLRLRGYEGVRIRTDWRAKR